jgi:hypothetical protein
MTGDVLYTDVQREQILLGIMALPAFEDGAVWTIRHWPIRSAVVASA